MTRNQLLPSYPKNWSGGVMFTVDGDGNIKPTAEQTVKRGETILTEPDPASMTTFGGKVCARQGDVCQCSALVVGGSSDNHMSIGTSYTVNSSVTVGSDFELYAITAGGTLEPGSNGDIHIGG